LPLQSLSIVKPAERLSTAKVFKTLDMSECSGKNPCELIQKMEKGVIFADFLNDLESPGSPLIPKLKILKEDLYEAGFNV
ncbi:CDPMEP kinase, partial [Gracilaria domingensis]